MSTQKPAPESCGRCGHPKADHVPVSNTGGSTVLVCPVSLFIEDTLDGLMEEDES